MSSIWASVREKMNRMNAKYGTGNKARSMLEDARRKVEDADAKLGVTKWFKTNVPKALDQYAKVKNTPVGRFANFIFWIWLFTSGIFWSLLYFGLTATFLINLLMPSLIADQLENMQRRAQEQMNAGTGGGMGGMGGMMRVAPERMRKMQVTTVCLEHGKPDPNPKMPYKIVPLDQVTKDPKVTVLCEALGNGLVTQNTAQAAAWHLMDKMSWGELAAKNRVESKYLGTIRWFSAIELRTAAAVVSECQRISKARKPSDETSESGYEG